MTERHTDIRARLDLWQREHTALKEWEATPAHRNGPLEETEAHLADACGCGEAGCGEADEWFPVWHHQGEVLAHAPEDLAWLLEQYEWMSAERERVIDWLSERAGQDVTADQVLFLFGIIHGRTHSGDAWSGTCWCGAAQLTRCTCAAEVMQDADPGATTP